MKKSEITQELPKWDTDMICYWKNGPVHLLDYWVVTNFQFAKKALSSKHNKTRDGYTPEHEFRVNPSRQESKSRLERWAGF